MPLGPLMSTIIWRIMSMVIWFNLSWINSSRFHRPNSLRLAHWLYCKVNTFWEGRKIWKRKNVSINRFEFEWCLSCISLIWMLLFFLSGKNRWQWNCWRIPVQVSSNIQIRFSFRKDPSIYYRFWNRVWSFNPSWSESRWDNIW